MPKVKSGPYHPVGEELKRQVLLNGTLRSVAPALGLDEGQAYNRFSNPDNVRLAFVLGLPSKLRISLWAILRKGLMDSDEAPLTILLSQREEPELPPSPFLDPLADRLVALLKTKVGRNLPAPSQHLLLEALEEQRFSDRAAAREGAEKLILEMVSALEETDGVKSRKVLGELAAALALWATIQRSRGFRDLAIKAFSFAFPLARRSKDPWAQGICYQRAAYLLGDLGRNDLGRDFIREAFIHFSIEGSTNLWKCHKDRGHFLAYGGQLDEAQEAYEVALEGLPGSEWRNRVGAYQGLGYVARHQNQPLKARAYLESAAAECRQIDMVLGHVKWSRAMVEVDLDNLPESRRYLSEAIDLLARYGSAGDVALICVDQVEVLVRQKDFRQAALTATEVAAWLPKLGANPILRRAFDKFLDLARAARIELAKLPEIRQSLRDAVKQGEAL